MRTRKLNENNENQINAMRLKYGHKNVCHAQNKYYDEKPPTLIENIDGVALNIIFGKVPFSSMER